MIENDYGLKSTLESVHKTIAVCRPKLKNGALLRNLTDLNPILQNDTSLYGYYRMLDRFT